MPMQHMREAEQLRKQIRQQKEQQAYFKQKEDAMQKAITQVTCRYIPNCKNKDSRQACAPCRRNEHHIPTSLPVDNYKEKISGMHFL